MISNRLSSSIIRPKTVMQAATSVKKPDMVTRFLKNKTVGKVCDIAQENPVICQSLFSLAICCGARPATNYVTTPDKKDAAYASCHSISSGIMGVVWPLIFATPLVAAVGVVLKKPQKFLKPEVIKKFYPSVGIEEVVKNGKKIKRVMTNEKGQLLRQNGTELCRELEPLKIKNGDARSRIIEIEKKLKKTKNQAKIEKLNEEKIALEAKHAEFLEEAAKFEKEHSNLYVDKSGVVRSREVLKTEKGKFQIDDKGEKAPDGKIGEKIGCVVQKDLTPVTEDIELGMTKEQNIQQIIKWIPDILLAPPRALITVKLIPWFLGLFGMEKKKKGHGPKQANQQPAQSIQQQPTNNVTSQNSIAKIRPGTFKAMQAHQVVATKKGGV